MTGVRHVHNATHNVADAHGRTIDLTPTRPTTTPNCPYTRPVAGPRARGRPGAVVIRVAVILTAGLVASVLLLVIRDVVTTVASTSVIGLILRALLTPASRRER